MRAKLIGFLYIYLIIVVKTFSIPIFYKVFLIWSITVISCLNQLAMQYYVCFLAHQKSWILPWDKKNFILTDSCAFLPVVKSNPSLLFSGNRKIPPRGSNVPMENEAWWVVHSSVGSERFAFSLCNWKSVIDSFSHMPSMKQCHLLSLPTR